MIIKTLVENKSADANIKAQHGLSLYIETNDHKILFDLGGSDLFIKNAFEKHYIKLCGFKFNVGLDPSLKKNEQIVFVDDFKKITENLILFSNVTGRTLFSPTNQKLFKQQGGRMKETMGTKMNYLFCGTTLEL